MIVINKPYITDMEDVVRCNCVIEYEGQEKVLWFEVDRKYRDYLCDDRADAYVIGFLNLAMRKGEDIKCMVPVTDELLYSLNVVLIHSLATYGRNLSEIKIIADPIPPLPQGTHVGTGCSCGVDSLYSIHMHLHSQYSSLELTDLCINNVGAFNECYEEYGVDKVRDIRYKETEEVARELNINLIKSDSNFLNDFYQDHHLSHSYSSCFAIYMLQKYWRTYYYSSSGYDFNFFNLTDNDLKDCSEYELLSLQCFSTSAIRILSDGGERTRLEKTRCIVNDRIAQKYLHVCISKPYNCNICTKCRRTLLTLDCLGVLDQYREVFDIDYYKSHTQEYLRWIIDAHLQGDEMNEPVYRVLKEQGRVKRSDIAVVEANHLKQFIKRKYRGLKRRLHLIKS